MDHSLPGFYVHEIFPGKNTGVDCHAFLQGIFLIQGSLALAVRFFTTSTTWEAPCLAIAKNNNKSEEPRVQARVPHQSTLGILDFTAEGEHFIS